MIGYFSGIMRYSLQTCCITITHPKDRLNPCVHADNLVAATSLWLLRTHAIDFALQYADVAQLVARNLAKVQVAGSNPVVRSE